MQFSLLESNNLPLEGVLCQLTADILGMQFSLLENPNHLPPRRRATIQLSYEPGIL